MPILEYKCLTVTYGTACAPFLATQTLCQLACDEGSQFPLAAQVLENDTYVDDIATGENSVDSALELYNQLHNLTQRGKFQLSKWVSNSEQVMQSVPIEHRGNQTPIDIESESCTKTLGLQWHPVTDSYAFKVEPLIFVEVITKRAVLSDTAKLFDPLGLLCPVTILPKLFMQVLWKENLGWDEQIRSDILLDWITYRKKLSLIESLRISRCAIAPDQAKLELHGFSDASERAYAAAVYGKSITLSGHVDVKLLTAKSRVAPLTSVSLPRFKHCSSLDQIP
ncbi:unnamed protein product [Allacma fusca]|uniref:Uncharacterized protein n=1 Tax=Allacma fusca TaxID=39272 RepID=A0A8J2LA62_9HEXA|nr:unnamed protein product [Allacma fusca]